MELVGIGNFFTWNTELNAMRRFDPISHSLLMELWLYTKYTRPLLVRRHSTCPPWLAEANCTCSPWLAERMRAPLHFPAAWFGLEWSEFSANTVRKSDIIGFYNVSRCIWHKRKIACLCMACLGYNSQIRLNMNQSDYIINAYTLPTENLNDIWI